MSGDEHFPGYQAEVDELARSSETVTGGLHMPGDPCASCDAFRQRERWTDDCDECFRLTAREAEKQQVVLDGGFPVTFCPEHVSASPRGDEK